MSSPGKRWPYGLIIDCVPQHVVETLNRLILLRGKPACVFADKGAEFTGRLMDLWDYQHDVRLDVSRPDMPTDNAYVESKSFNGSLRDECLNTHWFDSIEHAQTTIEARRIDYSESRPHMALGNIPPAEFAFQAGI